MARKQNRRLNETFSVYLHSRQTSAIPRRMEMQPRFIWLIVPLRVSIAGVKKALWMVFRGVLVSDLMLPFGRITIAHAGELVRERVRRSAWDNVVCVIDVDDTLGARPGASETLLSLWRRWSGLGRQQMHSEWADFFATLHELGVSVVGRTGQPVDSVDDISGALHAMLGFQPLLRLEHGVEVIPTLDIIHRSLPGASRIIYLDQNSDRVRCARSGGTPGCVSSSRRGVWGEENSASLSSALWASLYLPSQN